MASSSNPNKASSLRNLQGEAGHEGYGRTLQELDIKAVLNASSSMAEPAWLAELRACWFDLYRKASLPGPWHEEWRGTDLRARGFLSLPVHFPATGEQRTVLMPPQADQGSRSASSEIPLFIRLDDAVRSHPDRLRPWLMRSYAQETTPPLVLLNAALMTSGVLLHVPEGLCIRGEHRAVLCPAPQEDLTFPHNVIVAEKNARASFIEEYVSSLSGQGTFSCSVTEIFVGPGAEVDVLTLIRPDRGFRTCHRAVATVEAGGKLRWFIGTAGGDFARVDVEAALKGPEAESHILGIGVGEDHRIIDHRTVQHHVVGDTKSRIHFGTLLKGRSESLYRGMIRMDHAAFRSDAYQKNDNLMLEPGPRAQAIPKLEILTDDVKCSHGSTVGRLRDEDLFYMASRGISREAARSLIADGFIRRQLAGAGDSHPLAERLHAYLRKRVLGLADPDEDEASAGESILK
ncbi:MAG: SufB/SufD family protein [Planctomycetota bacterium]